jgi:hypothetical protein
MHEIKISYREHRKSHQHLALATTTIIEMLIIINMFPHRKLEGRAQYFFAMPVFLSSNPSGYNPPDQVTGLVIDKRSRLIINVRTSTRSSPSQYLPSPLSI